MDNQPSRALNDFLLRLQTLPLGKTLTMTTRGLTDIGH